MTTIHKLIAGLSNVPTDVSDSLRITDEASVSLMDFFADHDIDSLREQGLAFHGIDICGVYCLHTGRLVGTFDDFVLQFAIDEESAEDDESLIDALVTRVVASMRPSPMLNKPDRITLSNLAEKFPVDILAYLVNRLHGNRYLATHRVEAIAPYIARISTWKQWDGLAKQGVDLKPWIHWLLEIDAKRNLHDLAPPSGQFEADGKWTASPVCESLFFQVDAQNVNVLLAEFEKWVFARLREFDARDKEVLQTAAFMRGNSLSQPAHVKSWLENPQFASKKAEALHKAKNKPERVAKPKSEKAKAMDNRVNALLHLLDDVFDSKEPVVIQPKPERRLMTGAMLFKKKESN